MIRILTGTNNYLLRRELHMITAEFVAVHSDMAVERLDGSEAEYNAMQEAVQSLPFLTERKLVVLQTPGANKQFTENAASLLAELPDTTDLIIIEPKLDKRLAYYKLLKKQKGYTEFGELDANGLARWLVGLATEKGATISSADARYLVDRAGTNQQMLENELEKLSLYSPKINREVIVSLTTASPQSSIFQLLEAAFAGRTARMLELYAEQRALKVDPLQIIAMLAWQLHIFALVITAGQGRTADTIAREAKLSPYVVSKSVSAARGMSMQRIKQLIADLLRIDERLKSESLNADDVLQEYLLQLSK